MTLEVVPTPVEFLTIDNRKSTVRVDKTALAYFVLGTSKLRTLDNGAPAAFRAELPTHTCDKPHCYVKHAGRWGEYECPARRTHCHEDRWNDDSVRKFAKDVARTYI